MLSDKILGLVQAPLRVMAFKQSTLPHRKCRHAEAGHTEMIRAVIMASTGRRVGLQFQVQFFGRALHN